MHPSSPRPRRDVARPDDPVVLLVQPIRAPSTAIGLTVSTGQRDRLVELLRSRSLVVEHDLVPAGTSGLARIDVKVGDDPQAVGDVADCLEIMLQLLGRSVFGPVSAPSVVDVDRSGRDLVADAVERTLAPLRAFLPRD